MEGRCTYPGQVEVLVEAQPGGDEDAAAEEGIGQRPQAQLPQRVVVRVERQRQVQLAGEASLAGRGAVLRLHQHLLPTGQAPPRGDQLPHRARVLAHGRLLALRVVPPPVGHQLAHAEAVDEGDAGGLLLARRHAQRGTQHPPRGEVPPSERV